MDLFHFTMQQLAWPQSPRNDKDSAGLHHFIAAWLRHRYYLPVGQPLRASLRLSEDLGLDYLARLELVGDVETYYEVLLPDQEIAAFATVQDLENALEQQMACLAA